MFIFLHRFLLQRTTIATSVCVCVLSFHLFWTSGLWTCQPGSHRRKVTQDFTPSFCGVCLNFYRKKNRFSRPIPSSTVKSFFCTNEVIVLHLLSTIFSRVIVGNFPDVKLPPWWAEALPPYFGFTAFRQSRYRQKTKNRLQPKNYRHTLGLPPSAEVVTAKKRKTTYHQQITAVWHYRPKSTAICDTACNITAMSEWSEKMALRLS